MEKAFKEEKYRDGKFAFPSDNIDPKNKDKDWFLKYFNAMYSYYLRDMGSIPYSRRGEFALNRLYAEGNQPTVKYMDILCPKDEKTNEREGWMNISWDIISVAPKFRRIFTGMFEKLEHDIIATAVNPQAMEAKDEFKWRLWAKSKLADWLADMNRMMGIEESKADDWVPSNMQELQMFMEENFKLPTELSIECGCDYSFYLSNWIEVKKRMLEDFFDNAVAASQDYVDPIDGKVKARYLDVARLITRYTKSKTFDNIDWWAYMDEKTVAELRQTGGFTEQELFNIAKQYSSYGSNIQDYVFPDFYNYEAMLNDNALGMPYDNYRVSVLYGEMISTDTEKYKTKVTKDGVSRTFKESFNYNKGDTEKSTVDTHKYQCTYKGYWIIGTDYTYDCGKAYIVPRPDKKRPALSLNAYKYADKSILSSIIPNLDSMQLTWLKLQNAKAMAAPAGLQIEIGTLENISIGGNVLPPIQILALRRQSGDLLYKATTHHSEILSPNSGKPVSELQGGMGGQLEEFVQSFEFDLNIIRQQTGMNDIVDASTPNPEQPVKTSLMAVEAANNALQPIYSGYVFIKESVAKKFALRLQIMANNGEISGYYPALGRNVVQVFNITKDVSFDDMAIKIQLRPTTEMKQAVRTAAIEAERLGKNQGGITHSDYLYIESKISEGNLKYARMYLSYKENLYQKQVVALQDRNMKINGDNAQALEDKKIKAEQIKIQLETAADIDIKRAESSFRMKEEQQKHENKMREILATGQTKVGQEIVKGHINQKNNLESVS